MVAILNGDSDIDKVYFTYVHTTSSSGLVVCTICRERLERT